MTGLVLDCFVAMSWCFEDEATPQTDQILDDVCKRGACIPNLWHLEVTNVFLIASRRKRIAAGDIPLRFELLARLPIKTDDQTAASAFNEIHSLAETTGLTAYDAAYLELARRRKLDLATRDNSLARAARQLNITVL